MERAQEKEAQRLLVANSKKVGTVLAKVGLVLVSLKAILDKDQMDMVANVIEQGGHGDLDVDYLKDLVKEISDAKKAMFLATQVLATIARAPGA